MTNGKLSKCNIRTDIQCLRALAIFSVLGFHLWPHLFSLGYLGVDVFFVISGYLMTSILSRSSSNEWLTFPVLFDFYNRRAKRILPPYIMLVFFTLVVCQFVLTRLDLIDLKEDAIWALSIATNVKTIWKKQQYFDSTHLYKFLLHTWSLGLECQYYIFAPMILRTVIKFHCPLLLVSLISGISLAAHCLATDDAVSFGFLGCRLWQFMIGTAAFFVSQAPDNGYTLLDDAGSQSELNRDTNSMWKRLWYTLMVLLLSMLLLMPFVGKTTVKNTSMGFRLVSTFLTGMTIAYGAEATTILPIPLTVSKVLHYVGNISYSVYLVHWPLIVVSKYLDVFTSYYTLVLFVVIFAFGFLQYILFEKPLSKQPAKYIYTTILLIYVACIAILFNQNVIRQMFGNPENFLDANEKLLAKCQTEYRAMETCEKPNMLWLKNRKFMNFLCEFNGTGSLTVLLTGNSYSMFMYQSLLNAGKHKFKKLIVATASGCTIHKKLFYKGNDCKDVADNLPQTLADVKPDVVIIHQRMRGTQGLTTAMTDCKNDTAVAAMREDWAVISNYTKKIIIVEPNGILPAKQDLLKPIRLNAVDLSVYGVPLKDYKAEVDPGWDRVVQSVDKCPKCKLVGIRSYFCDSSFCSAYDTERRMSLYCDRSHHTSMATKRYMPAIVREIEL